MMRVKGVIFSLDGILADCGRKAFKQGVASFMQERGIVVSNKELAGLIVQGTYKKLLEDEGFISWCQGRIGGSLGKREFEEVYSYAMEHVEQTIEQKSLFHPIIIRLMQGLKQRGVDIAVLVDWPKSIGEKIKKQLEQQGIEPDCWVYSEETCGAESYPWTIFQIASILDKYPVNSLLFVGSTTVEIEGAIGAGLWTIATVFESEHVEKKQEELYLLGSDWVVGDEKELEEALETVLEKLERCY